LKTKFTYKYSFEIINYDIQEEFWKDKEDEIFSKDWKLLKTIDNKGLIISNHKEVDFVDFNGNKIWESSIECSGIPNDAKVSSNRLIVTTNSEDYHAWGYLGLVTLIDLKKGEVIKELKGARAQSLDNGSFLLGLEGYDIFNTWLYDQDGILLKEWRSYGQYLVINKEIFVIEDDRRGNTSAHIVKLCSNGKIKKGKKLKTSSSSNPLLLDDETFIFENFGELSIINNNLIEIAKFKLFSYDEKQSWRFSSKISKEKDLFEVSILERKEELPLEYKTHNWKVKID
jgi:hypothetical protein